MKNSGATLVIAKLDRLSRNLNFISQLMHSKVKFVCVDMPAAQPLTIHIFSAIAEHERTLISQRTASALSEKKRRGEKLGSPQNFTQDVRQKGPLRMRYLAQVNPNNIKARKTAKLLRDKGKTLAAIATELNEAGFKSATGRSLSAIQIQRLLQQT